MKKHVERMIKEHADLIIKTEKLNNFIYSNDGINIHTDIKNNTTQDQLLYNMTEYANKTMQLTAMKNYLKALECRLNNEGVFFENGEYLERVGKIIDTTKENDEDEKKNLNNE